MGRKQEDGLHDKVNAQIGFTRSMLSSLVLQVLLDMHESSEIARSEIGICQKYGEEIVKRFRAAMPMMKPEEE